MAHPLQQRLDQYSAKLSAFLREREANGLRGQPEMLHELEMTTDSDLLRKFSWKVAIIGAGVAFFAAPLMATVLRSLLPEILAHALWAVIKIAMAFSCALFGVAAYLTFMYNKE